MSTASNCPATPQRTARVRIDGTAVGGANQTGVRPPGICEPVSRAHGCPGRRTISERPIDVAESPHGFMLMKRPLPAGTTTAGTASADVISDLPEIAKPGLHARAGFPDEISVVLPTRCFVALPSITFA